MNELDLFTAALSIQDSQARAAYLEEHCQGNTPLRQRLEQLLKAYGHADQVLPEVPVIDPNVTEMFTGHKRDQLIGTLIAGKYKLLEEIGEGGMGTVFVAEQTEPVKRKVAIKLIKPGMDSRSVLARFEAERQALAMMDHPNIAKVLDAGLTEERRPYFVMEYIKGQPFTKYCDDVKLSIDERLKLFIQICQAVQHAHQKGIIHRDLKPGNILIALYDGKPVPKVIDFGLAKALHQSLTERTLYTGHEMVLGTPLYMSPEQAELNNLDIDTRSDIYSLGVILYELLTGVTPLEKQRFKQAAWAEVLRIIKEEEPSKPSTKLSHSESLPSVAAQRQMEPKKLSSLLKGDLDWIVMKALEKDRSRRYETANGFATDVQRYLSGEAVLAHPPTWWYRYQKFTKRHRGAILATYMLLVGIVIFTGSLYSQVERARTAERLAEEARDAVILQAQEERQAKERETAQRAKAEKAYARTADVLDTMVSEVTGDSLMTQKEITSEQKKFLTEVLTYYHEFVGEKADDTKTRLRTALAAYRVGLIESRLGRKEESAAAFRKAHDGYASLAAEFPAVPDYRQGLAASHNRLGHELVDLGKQPEAEEQYRKGLAIHEKLVAEFPDFYGHLQNLAASHTSLGGLLRSLGKRAEAEEQYRKALVIFNELATKFPAVPEHRQNLATIHNHLSVLLSDLGKRPEAEVQGRKALAIQVKLVAEFHAVPAYRQGLAFTHTSMAILLEDLGKRQEAEEQYRMALAIREKLVAEFPTVPEYRQLFARSYYNLGILLGQLGKQPEAEDQYRKALAIQENLVAEFPAVLAYRQELALNLGNLAGELKRKGNLTAAEQLTRKALVIEEKLVAEFPTVPQYRHQLASSLSGLGNLLARQGKQPEAEEQRRKGLDIQEKLAAEFPAVPAYRENLASYQSDLGVLLMGLGRQPEAEEQSRKALAIEEKLAADFPTIPKYQINLGGSYCNVGEQLRDGDKPSESLEWFDKAIGTLGTVHKREPRAVAAKIFLRNSYDGRARAYDRLRKYAEAARDWDLAIELSSPEDQPWAKANRTATRLRAGTAFDTHAELAQLRIAVTDASITAAWQFDHWYDVACVFSVASGKIPDKKDEYAKCAVEMLQRAVKAGFMDAATMKKDIDLAPLRDRADFKKLMAELEKTPESKK
ncbi:MAG: tetratricopeptide repeat protein [Gemmatales bacterium]